MENLSNKINNLNPQQKKAATKHFGNSLILAGAGTGKTTVITCKIGDMIVNGNINPHHVLAVTFTNKAAKEMAERISELIGKNLAKDITISTFHSFCLKTLRQYIHHLGYGKNFSIIDSADQQGIMKEYLGTVSKNAEFDIKDAYFLLNKISRYKQDNLAPDDINDDNVMFKNMYSFYQKKLFNMNLVDFDDLLYLTIKLWQQQPDILQKFQQRYNHIMVDEFQDTNCIQLKLLQCLTSNNNNAICAVGDDDQSIYHWRGADIKNILNFPNLFPNTDIIKLEQNYRSSNTILNAANSIIKSNKNRHSKKLWSAKGDGELISLIEAKDPEKEAEYVAYLISTLSQQKNLALHDFAILYRSNKQSLELEEKLMFRNIAYHIVGDRSFYNRREIKDAIAYLHIIDNPRDDMSLLRIINTPARGIGVNSILKAREYAQQNKKTLLQVLRDEEFLINIADKSTESIKSFINIYDKYQEKEKKTTHLGSFVDDYLREIGYIDGLRKIYRDLDETLKRKSNVMELINHLNNSEDKSISLKTYLDNVSLSEEYRKSKNENKNENKVNLLTIHAAKGLEFSYVFLIGLEQELFPHRTSIENGEIDEERRLFYVAVTRAKEKIFLLWAKDRKSYGNDTARAQSQFIDEIPKQFIEKMETSTLNPTLSGNDIESMIERFKQLAQ